MPAARERRHGPRTGARTLPGLTWYLAAARVLPDSEGADGPYGPPYIGVERLKSFEDAGRRRSGYAAVQQLDRSRRVGSVVDPPQTTTVPSSNSVAVWPRGKPHRVAEHPGSAFDVVELAMRGCIRAMVPPVTSTTSSGEFTSLDSRPRWSTKCAPSYAR